MGYTYILYASIFSFAAGLECRKHKHSPWWPMIVFLLPFTIVILIFKTRSKFRRSLTGFVFISFTIVAGYDGYLCYASFFKPDPHVNFPPVLKQLIELNTAVETSQIEIYDLLAQIDSMSMVLSRESDNKKVLGLITSLKQVIIENKKAILTLSKFIEDHSDLIRRKKLGALFEINKFYSSPILAVYSDSQATYLAALEELLVYSVDNFSQINKGQMNSYKKNYDTYFMRYRLASEQLNSLNRKRMLFVNKFLSFHYEIKGFIPGSHHDHNFRLWDRYSL